MSEIKVNKISPRSGTAFTLGDSGDTFTIPSGATINNQGTAVNFGATGSASWVTTVKTSSFTAVAGEGYFVNTTSGAITVTLPASPAAGAVVAIKDYANTFDTNNCTLGRNGSNIGGAATDATLSIEGIAVTLVFVDATKGWLVTDSGLQDEAPTAQFITASGGTISTVDTNFKVHTFTGPGTFTVCSAGNAAGSNTVSYLVVAGAGGGGGSALGFYSGAGGGGGGFRESKAATDTYTASPLNATSGPTYNLPVSAQGYTITIGAGGSPGCSSGGNSAPGCRSPGGEGTNSVFSTITSARGGGGGESGSGPARTPNGGVSGGSGGGGGGYNSNPDGGVAAGNTPSVSPPQGNSGGAGSVPSAGHGGGGGGATTAGTGTAGSPSAHANAGGAGAATSINGSSVTYANGGPAGACTSSAATAGASNSGIGGQGGNNYPPASNGALGGSGIVIIRYKFQ